MTTITTKLPAHNTNLPTGYRVGAHITGDTWYLIRESDDADVRVAFRPDYEMDEEEVEEAVEAAFAELDEQLEAAREEA